MEKLNDEELDRLFVEVMKLMQAHWTTTIKEFDLTASQSMALWHLEESQPMRSLAGKLACDASYITGLIDSLEQLKLVERQPDPTDRRVKILVLTAPGLKIQRRLNARLAERSPLLAGVSAEERRTLRGLLQSIIKSQPEDEKNES